jgi:hypothetical protein
MTIVTRHQLFCGSRPDLLQALQIQHLSVLKSRRGRRVQSQNVTCMSGLRSAHGCDMSTMLLDVTRE